MEAYHSQKGFLDAKVMFCYYFVSFASSVSSVHCYWWKVTDAYSILILTARYFLCENLRQPMRRKNEAQGKKWKNKKIAYPKYKEKQLVLSWKHLYKIIARTTSNLSKESYTIVLKVLLANIQVIEGFGFARALHCIYTIPLRKINFDPQFPTLRLWNYNGKGPINHETA